MKCPFAQGPLDNAIQVQRQSNDHFKAKYNIQHALRILKYHFLEVTNVLLLHVSGMF
jgi:hypothetical protein